MPAVPGGTAIGIVYVKAPVAPTLNCPGTIIGGGVSAAREAVELLKASQQKTARPKALAVRLLSDVTPLPRMDQSRSFATAA